MRRMPDPVENLTSDVPMPEDGIGERIRRLREKLRLSQSQFAERTKAGDPEGKGVSRTVLIGYESGKFRPGARELRVLCGTFRVSPTWLLLGEDPDPKADLETASAMLLAGIGEASLDEAFQLALTMLCLKQFEREALSTLIHGIASARRGAPSHEAVVQLAQWMAYDADRRFIELTGQESIREALREAKGAKKIEVLATRYEQAAVARNQMEDNEG